MLFLNRHPQRLLRTFSYGHGMSQGISVQPIIWSHACLLVPGSVSRHVIYILDTDGALVRHAPDSTGTTAATGFGFDPEASAAQFSGVDAVGTGVERPVRDTVDDAVDVQRVGESVRVLAFEEGDDVADVPCQELAGVLVVDAHRLRPVEDGDALLADSDVVLGEVGVDVPLAVGRRQFAHFLMEGSTHFAVVCFSENEAAGFVAVAAQGLARHAAAQRAAVVRTPERIDLRLDFAVALVEVVAIVEPAVRLARRARQRGRRPGDPEL